MKKLQIMAVCLLGLGVFTISTSFKPEAPKDKKQLVQPDYRPVLVNCLTPAGQTYAIRNNCVFSPGDICVATLCPGGPVQPNLRPVVIACVRGGLVYAFANNCVNQLNNVCRPTLCP